LNHVRAHDYAGFYEQEIAHRRESLWPPLCRLVNFRITAPTQEAAERGAALCADVARKALERASGRGEALEVLGPAPAVVTRVRNRWRWQVLLKGNSLTEMHSVAKAVLESTGRRSFGGGAVLIVDVDPAGVL
jgi:primosomal protein N' (replication factor Y)